MKDPLVEKLRSALLEIEWASRGRASTQTLKTINELAREALMQEGEASVNVVQLRQASAQRKHR